MSDELPPAWARTTIGDVAEVQLGRQRSPQHHAGEQMRPYLRSANVTWQGIDINNVNQMNFDDADFAKYKLDPGDLLLNEASGSPNEVGKPAIWKGEIEDCCFQNTLLRLRPSVINRSYLYWYCYRSALMGQFGTAGRGVNIRHLGKRGLAQFPIPVAPLAEQERIVAAIKEHFSRLDFVEAAMESSNARISKLFEISLQDELRGYPTQTAPLNCFLSQSLRNGRSVPTALAGGFPVLRLTCLQNGLIDTKETKQGEFGEVDPHQFRVEPNDFLISRGNGSLHLVGLGGLVPSDSRSVAFPDTLIRAQVDQTRLRPAFLRLIWNSQLVRRQLEVQARTTAGIYKVNQSMISKVALLVPQPDAQDRIVQHLERIRASIAEVDAAVTQSRRRCSALRLSILSAAFSGQLVQQDPDDEPASVLLDRIAASHSAGTARRRART